MLGAMNDAPGAPEVFSVLIRVKVASVSWSGQMVREMAEIHGFGGVRFTTEMSYLSQHVKQQKTGGRNTGDYF